MNTESKNDHEEIGRILREDALRSDVLASHAELTNASAVAAQGGVRPDPLGPLPERQDSLSSETLLNSERITELETRVRKLEFDLMQIRNLMRNGVGFGR